MINLLKHELRSRLTGMIGWGIGLALFGNMYILIYPEMSEQMSSLADLSIYQAMNIEMSSFAGFISSVVVQYVPLLLAIYGVITSTDALAGEEDKGTLELILAMPIPRWQIVTIKAIAMSIAALVVIIIAAVGYVIGLESIRGSLDIQVTSGELFLAVLNGWPITIAFMMMGLFLGAYLPSRRTAALTITVIFVANYFGFILFGLVESLEGLQPLSLFNYFDTSSAVFNEGVQLSDVAVLLFLALLFFGLALLSFQRRDVTVGKWPWQRASISS